MATFLHSDANRTNFFIWLGVILFSDLGGDIEEQEYKVLGPRLLTSHIGHDSTADHLTRVHVAGWRSCGIILQLVLVASSFKAFDDVLTTY